MVGASSPLPFPALTSSKSRLSSLMPLCGTSMLKFIMDPLPPVLCSAFDKRWPSVVTIRTTFAVALEKRPGQVRAGIIVRHRILRQRDQLRETGGIEMREIRIARIWQRREIFSWHRGNAVPNLAALELDRMAVA